MLGYIIAVSQLGLCGVYILICQNVIKQSSEGVMILLVGIIMMKCCVSYNATDRQGQKKILAFIAFQTTNRRHRLSVISLVGKLSDQG